jgi:hypothetical protein
MPLDLAAHDQLLHLLQPVADQLAAAAAHPPHVAKGDWLGPASSACERLESTLAGRLGHALAELDLVLSQVRTEVVR